MLYVLMAHGLDLSSESTENVQVASHLISGLSQAVDACTRASSVPYGMQSITVPSRIAITKAAYAVRRLSMLSLWLGDCLDLFLGAMPQWKLPNHGCEYPDDLRAALQRMRLKRCTPFGDMQRHSRCHLWSSNESVAVW